MNINDLCPEMLIKIFSYLDLYEKLNAAKVCHHWFELVFESITEINCDYVDRNPYDYDYDSGSILSLVSTSIESQFASNLDSLVKFYRKQFGTDVEWWHLLRLFPRLKKLWLYADVVCYDMLNNIALHCKRLEFLSLSIEPFRGQFDWYRFGTKLENLVSLDLSISPAQFVSSELQMIKGCPKLQNLDLTYAKINDDWRQIIPSRIKRLRLKSSTFNDLSSQHLFSYICEDVTQLQSLIWEDSGFLTSEQIQELSSLKELKIVMDSWVSTPSVFRYCKKLEKLYLSELNTEIFPRYDSKLRLPHLKFLAIGSLHGDAPDFSRLCTSLKVLEIRECDIEKLKRWISSVRYVDSVTVDRVTMLLTTGLELRNEAFALVFLGLHYYHRHSPKKVYSLMLKNTPNWHALENYRYDVSSKAAFVKGDFHIYRQSLTIFTDFKLFVKAVNCEEYMNAYSASNDSRNSLSELD